MDTQEIIDSYVQSWNGHDPGRIAGHFTQDGIRRWQVALHPMIGGPTTFEGRNEVEDGIRVFVEAVPDLTVEPERMVQTDDGAILEWRLRGTHTGAWGGWTGQGEEVDFPGISVYRIVDGEIAEERMYFDPDVMARNWTPPAG